MKEMPQDKTIRVTPEQCLTGVETSPSTTTRETCNHTHSLTGRTSPEDHVLMASASPESGHVDGFGHSLDGNSLPYEHNTDINVYNTGDLLDCETLETSPEVFVQNQADEVSDASPKFYYSLLPDNCDDTNSNLSDSDKESVETNLSMSTDDSGQMLFYLQKFDENVISKSADQQEMCSTQDKKLYTVQSTHTFNNSERLTFKNDLSSDNKFISPCVEMETAASIRIDSQQEKGHNSLDTSFTDKGDKSVDVKFRLKSIKPKRYVKDGYHYDMSKQRYNDVFCSVTNCAISNSYDNGTLSLESFIVTDTSDLAVIDIFSLPDDFLNSWKTDPIGSNKSRKHHNATDEDYSMHAAKSRNPHSITRNAETTGGCYKERNESDLNTTEIIDLNQCHESKATVPTRGCEIDHSAKADQSEHNEFDSIIKTKHCDAPSLSGVYNGTICVNGAEPNHKVSVRKGDQYDLVLTKSAGNAENTGGPIDTCSLNRTVNNDTPFNCDTDRSDISFNNTEKHNVTSAHSDKSFGDRTELNDMSNHCETKHSDTRFTYTAKHTVTSCHSDTRQSDTSFSTIAQHNDTSSHCETEQSAVSFISDIEHSESPFVSETDGVGIRSAPGLTDDYYLNVASDTTTIERQKNMQCWEQMVDEGGDIPFSTSGLESGRESNVSSSLRKSHEYHTAVKDNIHIGPEHITVTQGDSSLADFNEFDEFQENYALDLFFREDTTSDLSDEFNTDLLSEQNGSEISGPDIDNADSTTPLSCDNEGHQAHHQVHNTCHTKSTTSSEDDEPQDNLQMENHNPFPAKSEGASSRMKHDPLRRTSSKLELALSTEYDQDFFMPPSYDESTIRKIHERLTNEGLYDISKPIEQNDLKTLKSELASTEVHSLCCVCGSIEADNMKAVCDDFEYLADGLSSKSSHSVYTNCSQSPETWSGAMTTNQKGELSYDSEGNHSENSTGSTLNFNEIGRKTKIPSDDEPGIYDVYPAYDTDDDSKDNRRPTSLGYIERKLKTVRRINIIDKIFHLTLAKREDENTHEPVKIFRGNPIC